MTAKRLFGVVKGHREHIADHTGRLYSDSEVADLLNTVHEENEQLEEAREYYQENFLTMKTERNQFKRENELLKFQLDECRNNKLFSRRELEKENEQLKQSNEDARHILKREFDFATEQRQKHLDDPVVTNAYDIIRFDMRKALDKLGWLE